MSGVPGNRLYGPVLITGLIFCSLVTAGDVQHAKLIKPLPHEKSLVKLKAEVTALCTKLGSTKFRARRSAMRRIIQIGKGHLCKEDDRASIEEHVILAMEKLSEHKDPEVRMRAKKILRAMIPPPPTPSRSQVVEGW